MNNYKEKYEDMFNRLNNLLDNTKKQGRIIASVEDIEATFPELKESEDEKIRKEIIRYLKVTSPAMGENIEKMVAWLEKQGEQKPKGKSALEAIKEERVDDADKVEHGFKVGDWIVGNINKVTFLLKSFNSGYCTLEDTEGRIYSPCVPPNEVDYHLWTIKDAKDGDVLSWDDSKCIAIFKNIYDEDSFNSYGFVGGCTGTFESRMSYHDIEGAHPATKEHRDTLIKAMADAGYAFDFEKKELKKIVAPKFKIGDTMRTLQEAYNGITSGLPVVVSIDNEYYHCNNELIAIKDQDNYEYPPMNRRQKPSWSEEDENLLKASFENLTELKDMYGEEYGKVGDCISWLNSLKDRYTWKPSDEQIKALEHFVRSVGESGYASPYDNNTKLLYSLLGQLKKLREK